MSPAWSAYRPDLRWFERKPTCVRVPHPPAPILLG